MLKNSTLTKNILLSCRKFGGYLHSCTVTQVHSALSIILLAREIALNRNSIEIALSLAVFFRKPVFYLKDHVH